MAILEKWFGSNYEAIMWLLNTISIFLGVIAFFLFLSAAWLFFYTRNHLDEEKDDTKGKITRKSRKHLISGVLCAAFSIIWPFILLGAYKFGGDKIVPSPSQLFLYFDYVKDFINIWA